MARGGEGVPRRQDRLGPDEDQVTGAAQAFAVGLTCGVVTGTLPPEVSQGALHQKPTPG